MKAKVLEIFYDKEESKVRKVGEIFELSKDRYDYIISKNENLIECVEESEETEDETESEFPKHTGGGWYELSNGEKVQGKEEAIQAESELM